MPTMLQTLIATAIQWVLGLLGSALVTRGVWTEDQLAQVAGAVIALVPLIWSVVQKKNATQIQKVALALPARSTEADLAKAVRALKSKPDA